MQVRIAMAVVLPFFLSLYLYGQDGQPCNCPPLKLYVYDTKIDFQPDSGLQSSVAGQYVEAQNSGDWLEGTLLKQQSDEFKVFKGIRPGASQGTTYEPAPADGGSAADGVDFTSYAEVSRSGGPGHYTYSVTVRLIDANTHATVTTVTLSTSDLGKVDDLIDQAIASFSPVYDKLRDYQKKIRDESGGKKWIYLKWKATADKSRLKLGETTRVHIKMFDCVDGKPAANQHFAVKAGTPAVGILSPLSVTSNSAGEATLLFTARKEGETIVFPDYTFTAVNGKSGYHALPCGGDLKIDVGDEKYKVTMEVEITGPDALHWLLRGEATTQLISYADGTFQLKPVDHTRNMQVHVLSASTAHMKLIGKYDYPIPFTLNIGNIRKGGSAEARVAFDTFSPSENGQNSAEPYQLPHNYVQSFPGWTSHLVQNLFHDIERDVATKSIQPEMHELTDLQRIKAHAKDPGYWKTAQGRADMQKMQKMMEERGRGDLFQHMNHAPANATKADSAFVEGMRGTQLNPSAYGAPPMQNQASIMGNMLQFSGMFNDQAATPLNIFQEADAGGGLKGRINIKVIKM